MIDGPEGLKSKMGLMSKMGLTSKMEVPEKVLDSPDGLKSKTEDPEELRWERPEKAYIPSTAGHNQHEGCCTEDTCG